ncbi:hypothetical protein [Aridibaculum aurantiacum]|uniref:hypothetical protein n=1 Tax=Aridibaculum aurantiacum TaxID=2810307 RepID=UPI001A97C1ED|nr:hypothetical protein [Aridibaculum aurantiacum]
MSDQHFDNFIRNKLQDHASPVPGDMWQRILAEKEKDRKPALWWNNYKNWMLILTALLVTSSFIYFYSKQDDKGITHSSSSIAPANIPAQQTAEPTINSIPGGNSSNEPLDLAATSTAPSTETGIANSTTSDEAKTATSTAAKVATTNSSILTTDKEVEQVATTRDRSATSSGNEKRSARAFAKFKKEVTAPAFGQQVNEKKPLPAGLPAIDVSFNKKAAAEEGVTVYNRTDAIPMLAKRSGSAFSSSHNGTLNKLNFLPVVECPPADGERRSNWFLEVFASPDYAIKNTTSSNDEYLRRKDSTENFRSAFTAGFRISKTIGQNMMLKSGLQFSQINEKFNFRSENERKTVTVVTIRTIVRSPGDTIRVTDTSTMEQIGYRVKTTFNRYRSIDVPVILGYEWGNENFRTSINGGLIFNLQSWQQGDMLDTSYNPVMFTKGNSMFKRNIGLGVFASVAFYKSIGASSEIFAEPYFRYHISNMTNSSLPFQQKFHAAGLNIGLRFKLNGRQQSYSR